MNTMRCGKYATECRTPHNALYNARPEAQYPHQSRPPRRGLKSKEGLSTMTRKDYIFIAACVASAKDVIGRDAVLHLARHFAAEFSRENSQFDENRFLNNVRKESGQ